jgi:hypothetical protein
MINIDRLVEEHYAPWDPEFQEDLVEDAMTGERIDPEEVHVEEYCGKYFTADTLPEFAVDHPDLLEEYLDDDDPLLDFETNPAHWVALVKRAQQSMFGRIKEKGAVK